MVQGRFKSGRFRKVQRKVPGGRTVTRYDEATPKGARCGECGTRLPGIPRLSATRAKNAAKTSKRPERPYGGALCSSCTRRHLLRECRK